MRVENQSVSGESKPASGRRIFRGCIAAGVAVAASSMLLLAACGSDGGGSGGQAGASSELVVRTGVVAEGYDVPAFYAEKMGYFEDEGLDVEVLQGAGSAGNVKLVGTGKADFGVVDLSAAATAKKQGMPVKAIGAVFHKTPLATIVLDSSEIKSPEDLKGHQIGETPESSTSRFFPAYLDALGMTPSDIKSVTMGAAGQPQALVSERIDAFNSYALEQVPLVEIALETPARAFEWGDYLTMLGLGIVANSDAIEQDPEVMKKFMRAYAKGYVESMKNPEEGAQAILDKYPRAGGGSLETIVRQWELSQELQYTDSTDGKPLFWMSEEDWNGTIDTLNKYADGEIDAPASDFYTNDLIADVTKPPAPPAS